MYYSAISAISIIICILTNYDVLSGDVDDRGSEMYRTYRRFLLFVLLYFVTDAMWGILYDHAPAAATFADTTIYFIAMAVSVLAWTHYVILYLEDETAFRRALSVMGWIFLIFELSVVVINLFRPVLFYFDGDGVYHALSARYITLGFQILMFFITTVYTLFISSRTEDTAVKLRYRAVGLFGVVMIVMIAAQIEFPLLPYYAVGYLIGTCLIHTFVHENEKTEHRRRLEEMLRKEQEQKREIIATKSMAYSDSLTGVKNSHAYVEAEETVDRRISDGSLKEFGVVVFDLNGLKNINDTRGHEAGDAYIMEASRTICSMFAHSPVFRIGGDEFVAFLEGSDYKEREYIIERFNTKIEENVKAGRVVIAAGMDEYRPGTDNSYHHIFKRADKKMYERKSELKGMSESESKWKDTNILKMNG